jgi:predicted MFS family arabinose efflux permease
MAENRPFAGPKDNGIAPRRIPRPNPAWLLIGFLWFAYLLNHADRQVVYTLFPALQKEFGFSDAVMGLTGALFLWVYGLCSPVAGILGDRTSKRVLVTASIGIWSSFTALSGLSPNGTFLLACRALLGVSESIFMPAAFALMANAHDPGTRSRAISIFATSQLAGVALGGSLSGYIAERYNWRASFLFLGLIGILFAGPLWMFLRSLPEHFERSKIDRAAPPATPRSFFALFRIPTLRIVTIFVSIGTFGLFLVYTWLPTFLYDKFSLGLARAGFEASVYPQAGTALGLLAGGLIADRWHRRAKAGRFWVVSLGFLLGSPCIFWLGAAPTLRLTRIAAIGFGFFVGFISGNQAACAFDVVPASLRASTTGVLNLVGATMAGFAPFLGGLSRKTIGVDRLMSFSALLFLASGILVIYGTRRYFDTDHRLAGE